MNRFWSIITIITLFCLLIGMFCWGLIISDNIDSIHALRMDNKALIIKLNQIEDKQEVIDDVLLKLFDADDSLLANQDYAIKLIDKLIIKDIILENHQNVIDDYINDLNPSHAINVGIDSSLVVLGNGGHGSGFFIDKERGVILTAGHVSNHFFEENLYICQKNIKVPVLEALSDSKVDVGLLFIDPNLAKLFSAKDIKISSTNAEIGDLLVSSGYPVFPEDSPYASVGVVVGIDVDDANSLGSYYDHTIKFHLEVIPGMSGGPILNVSGEIVSINNVSQCPLQISCGPSANQIKQAIIRMMWEREIKPIL